MGKIYRSKDTASCGILFGSAVAPGGGLWSQAVQAHLARWRTRSGIGLNVSLTVTRCDGSSYEMGLPSSCLKIGETHAVS